MINGANLKKRKKVRKPSYYVGKVIAYSILTITAILFLIPFLFAISTSLTSENNIFDFKWIPEPIDIGNYARFFAEHDVLRAFGNSLFIVLTVVIFGVFCSALAAYAFARLRFKGKSLAFFAILSSVVIPGIITMIPSYILFTNFYKWNGTPLPLIVPGMFGGALTMFFLHQYFLTLPRELEEAAQIDGMTHFGIFIKIIIPLSVPALITQFILSFNGVYNDYLGPLLYLGSNSPWATIQLVVASVQTQMYRPYTLMMAAAIVALTPTLLLYVFAQKYFTEGISMTGLK